MDTTKPNMHSLFAQLGLPNSDSQIASFVDSHALPQGTRLADAGFWNDAQRHFIEESLREDAAWCEVIDELDAMLR
ncbi:DUF2789 domain-containing protein [Pseudoalteromonas fenneropenaei]|uniref:DUF2789 domain-containing protein n=1 Tax=Pseudoalteromonas fenneropenaei TaxID=1737459 RepID=A0ABV7CGH9_9GAMM